MITILVNEAVTEKLLFEAKNNDELLGTLEADVNDKALYITRINSDRFLVDGLCRAAMNYAHNRNIISCVIETQEKSVQDELLRLDFISDENNRIDDIGEFFKSHKNCAK